MANLTLELNIYSAKDLENVNLITKMDVYAVVWTEGDDSQKNHKEKTTVDRTGESEPTWNHTVKFSIDQRLAREGRLTLVVKLVCDRIFGGKDLGEVQVPILELLNSSPSFNGNTQGMRFMTYQVRNPCGKGQGSLNFSYRFDMPSFKPDLPASPVHPNPIDASPDIPSMTYPPTSEAGFYPPPPSIVYPPSYQPQGYSAPSCTYPYPYPHQYDSPYPGQSITAYPPSPSGSNLYPQPPTYGTSPPNHHNAYPPHHSNIYHPPYYGASPSYHTHLYPPPPEKPGQSYHQAQPSQSFHGYVPPSPQSQHEYGYQPSSPGYGHGCPPTQTPPKKNKPGVGLGMGAGLLGGALGGLLLGDLVSDIGFDF